MQMLYHALSLMQQQYDSLAQMVMDNQLASCSLLAEWGGICSLQGTSYWIYNNNLRQVQADFQKLFQDTQIMHDLTKIFQQILTIPEVLELFSWFSISRGKKGKEPNFKHRVTLFIINFVIIPLVECSF